MKPKKIRLFFLPMLCSVRQDFLCIVTENLMIETVHIKNPAAFINLQKSVLLITQNSTTENALDAQNISQFNGNVYP